MPHPCHLLQEVWPELNNYLLQAHHVLLLHAFALLLSHHGLLGALLPALYPALEKWLPEMILFTTVP
jgi:hypothetical protein